MTNYPVPYQNNWSYSGIGQQMYPQYGQQSMAQAVPQAQTSGTCMHGLIWVDGEIGAKAYQMPQGLPANQPIALWDTNDTIIYLKSVNPMGMPNPIQKARYTLEEQRGTSGARNASQDVVVPDMSEYVRKDDMERMKRELMESIQNAGTNSETSGRRASRGE